MVTSKENDACFDEAHHSVVYFVGGQRAMEADDAHVRATAPASCINPKSDWNGPFARRGADSSDPRRFRGALRLDRKATRMQAR